MVWGLERSAWARRCLKHIAWVPQQNKTKKPPKLSRPDPEKVSEPNTSQ